MGNVVSLKNADFASLKAAGFADVAAEAASNRADSVMRIKRMLIAVDAFRAALGARDIVELLGLVDGVALGNEKHDVVDSLKAALSCAVDVSITMRDRHGLPLLPVKGPSGAWRNCEPRVEPYQGTRQHGQGGSFCETIEGADGKISREDFWTDEEIAEDARRELSAHPGVIAETRKLRVKVATAHSHLLEALNGSKGKQIANAAEQVEGLLAVLVDELGQRIEELETGKA